MPGFGLALGALGSGQAGNCSPPQKRPHGNWPTDHKWWRGLMMMMMMMMMIMAMEKQRWEQSEKREEERRSGKWKSTKKEDAGARKGREVAIHYVFPMIVAPEGRKVGSLKRRVRIHLARWEMKNCTPLWREAHVQFKMYKAHFKSDSFVEKVHAVVARSTFPCQQRKKLTVSDHFWKLRWWKSGLHWGAKQISKSKCTNTPCSDHFWKLTCRKSARRSGAKRVSKSKVKKTKGFGALLEVQMSLCVAGARDSACCYKWAKTGEGFVAILTTITTTVSYTTLQHYTTPHYHYQDH